MTLSVLLARYEADAAELSAEHPPKIHDSNKKLIHSICSKPVGRINATRWQAGELPKAMPRRLPALSLASGPFSYDAPSPGCTEWHLNFADAHLFYAYGSGLFAQDEHQCAEHPVLASLREKLVAAPIEGFAPYTTVDDRATPVLVKGAARNCVAELKRGNFSIYGNAMSRAHPTTIRALVSPLEPPTFSNILAIEAIPGGSGRYSPEEISRTVMTAAAGFGAAAHESAGTQVVIHTGFWGCGAFGGNRRLMTICQLLAARIAAVNHIVFHAFDAAGVGAWKDAKDLYETLDGTVPEALARIDDLAFEWGTSDGN